MFLISEVMEAFDQTTPVERLRRMLATGAEWLY